MFLKSNSLFSVFFLIYPLLLARNANPMNANKRNPIINANSPSMSNVKLFWNRKNPKSLMKKIKNFKKPL